MRSLVVKGLKSGKFNIAEFILVCMYVYSLHIHLYMLTRVHNISREGECLTAYTCFKRTASSTESTPSGEN